MFRLRKLQVTAGTVSWVDSPQMLICPICTDCCAPEVVTSVRVKDATDQILCSET